MTDVIDALPPHYRYAVTQIGVKEIAGRKHSPTVVGYAHSIGMTKIVDDEAAWCATFVGACLERSGITSTRTAWARDYLKWGTKITSPVPGCVVVLNRNGKGHVGFFVRQEGRRILLLGGNQNDQVCYAWFNMDAAGGEVLGYRMPPAAVEPEVEQPTEQEWETTTEVEPEPVAPPAPKRPAKPSVIAQEGSRSMGWLQALKLKLGLGVGGFGFYEITSFFKGAKGVLHDVNVILVDNAPVLLGAFLVACLVSAVMAAIRLAEAYEAGRYDPRKWAQDVSVATT